MWRWEDVREGVKMSRCEDEQMWEKMWTLADVREDVREDVEMSRCERRCERRCEGEQMWEKMWRWADVKMSRCERRCEDEQMWEKMWRWADVKMSRCERRCERRCEDEQMWEKMWRWEDGVQTPTIGRTLRSDALGKNEAIFRDFFMFQSWHQKRSNSPRLPQCLNVTTSKTKQVCKTSSFFKVDSIKNEAILRDLFKKKLCAGLTASYQFVLHFFESICLNYCACHEKVMPGHTKCCTCHVKSSQQTWRSDAPKCSPSQEISARIS